MNPSLRHSFYIIPYRYFSFFIIIIKPIHGICIELKKQKSNSWTNWLFVCIYIYSNIYKDNNTNNIHVVTVSNIYRNLNYKNYYHKKSEAKNRKWVLRNCNELTSLSGAHSSSLQSGSSSEEALTVKRQELLLLLIFWCCFMENLLVEKEP